MQKRFTFFSVFGKIEKSGKYIRKRDNTMELFEFIEMINKSFGEIKMCGGKVVEIKKQTKEMLENFNKEIDFASKKIDSSYAGFSLTENNFSSSLIDQYASITEKLQASSFNDEHSKVISQLQKNSQKLNLLLEASIKIKKLIDSRVEKAIKIFSKKELEPVQKIIDATALFTSSINKEVSVLNAQIAFALSRELEIKGKVQTYSVILSQLQKYNMQLA